MSNRLTGVRLGRRQRELLNSAPGPEVIRPRPVHAAKASKSAANAYLKAAHGLEKAGLVTLTTELVWTRVPDSRRERPYYRDGAFWLHADGRRDHLVRRRALRRTPFGQGVAIEFRRELDRGGHLRWTDARVERAARKGEAISVPGLIWQVEHLESDRVVPPPPSSGLDLDPNPVEFRPDGVCDQPDLDRWRACCRSARKLLPKRGDEAVLAEALDQFRVGYEDEVDDVA